ncbi:MAG: hypothetical protein ACREIF_13100 [Chthoniobacterales bacterium]
MLLLAAAQAEYLRATSPNGRFEAYTTANSPDGDGMKLFLRRARARETGSLLCQNERWIDAKWSPDSRFLAVIDHPDGHIADVYVFGVTAAEAAAPPAAVLLYHTPNPLTYDVQWDVVGWDSKLREVILKQEVRDQNAGTHGTHVLTTRIGERPLKRDVLK